MTIADIVTRVQTVVQASPFLFETARDPFDFDLQPATRLDGVYRLEATLEGQDGYLGPYCEEQWAITIWLARRAKGHATAAYDALLADVSSLTAALERDGMTRGDYVVTDAVSADLPQPASDADYLVARLRAGVAFDRAL